MSHVFRKYFLWAMLLSSLTSMAQVNDDLPHVIFDPEYLADTRLMQVIFPDNPQKDRAFLIFPPKGWIRIRDITNQMGAGFNDMLSKTELRDRYQALLPYVVIAKSLDGYAWRKAPYQYRAPVQELQMFATESMLEQYSQFKNFDRSTLSDPEIYSKLVEEVGENEFGLNLTWPWCDTQRMKRPCILLKSRLSLFDMEPTSLDFSLLPKTLEEFKEQIKPQLIQWYVFNRRLHAFRMVYAESIAKSPSKPSEKQTENEKIQAASKAFYKYLWNNVNVFSYADYCDFPTLICNRFDANKFQIPLTNENLEALLRMNFSESEFETLQNLD